jgi:hypothetical protein
LVDELQRATGGDGRRRELGEVEGDLDGRVAAADHHDALTGERLR